MRVQTHTVALGLIAVSASLSAVAQTELHSDTTDARHRDSFQMICRGGPRLRVSETGLRDIPAIRGWVQIATIMVDFNRSAQPPDHSGRNLRPSECSPASFRLRKVDPARIQNIIVLNTDGLRKDSAPDVAERYPDARSMSDYLKDPNHYWSFRVIDSGKNYFDSGVSGYWKPEFHKEPAASTTSPATGSMRQVPPVTSAGVAQEGQALVTCMAQRLKMVPFSVRQTWPTVAQLPSHLTGQRGELLSEPNGYVIADGYQEKLYIDARASAAYLVRCGGIAGGINVYGPLPAGTCVRNRDTSSEPEALRGSG